MFMNNVLHVINGGEFSMLGVKIVQKFLKVKKDESSKLEDSSFLNVLYILHAFLHSFFITLYPSHLQFVPFH